MGVKATKITGVPLQNDRGVWSGPSARTRVVVDKHGQGAEASPAGTAAGPPCSAPSRLCLTQQQRVGGGNGGWRRGKVGHWGLPGQVSGRLNMNKKSDDQYI